MKDFSSSRPTAKTDSACGPLKENFPLPSMDMDFFFEVEILPVAGKAKTRPAQETTEGHVRHPHHSNLGSPLTVAAHPSDWQ